MMKRFKKTLAWVLSLAMVVTMIPAFTVVSSADVSVCKLVKSADNEVVKGQYATVQEAANQVNDEFDTIIMFADSKESVKINYNCTLNLDGHVIDATGTGDAAITILLGAEFTLTDSDDDAAHGGDYSNLPEGGVITGGNRGVNVNKGVFSMNGGTITGNTAEFGGGVYLNSGEKFYMYGGRITGNTATEAGGGVFMSSDYDDMHGTTSATDFILTDGAIFGNTARAGGGVYVSAATFTMKDGAICNNINFSADKPTYGGAVYVADNGTFKMEDGTISGNEALFGAGVRLEKAVFEMSGGYIVNNGGLGTAYGGVEMGSSGGTIKIKGTPVIKDNFDYEYKQSNCKVLGLKKIELEDALNEDSLIGITYDSTAHDLDITDTYTAQITDGWDTYMTGEDENDYFFSDNSEEYNILTKDGEVALGKGAADSHPVHDWVYYPEYGDNPKSIYARCFATGNCDLAGYPVKATLNAPVADGSAGSYQATLTYTDSDGDTTNLWQKNPNLKSPVITYKAKEGSSTVYPESTVAPKKIGEYTATVSVSWTDKYGMQRTASASVDYVITVDAVEESGTDVLGLVAFGILFKTLKAWLAPLFRLFTINPFFFRWL